MRYEKIIKKVLITEKATRLRESNCYVFIVNPGANRHQIREAVEKLFNVKVTGVRTSNYQGKLRRLGRSSGYTPKFKKAMVTIKEGQTIEIVEGV